MLQFGRSSTKDLGTYSICPASSGVPLGAVEVLWVLPWDATIFTPPALLVASSLCKTTGTKSQWEARHLVKGGNPLR